MAFGIYKAGQGYWVRVLTATFAGVVILAASAWLWQQLDLAAQKLPKSAWTFNVAPATGAASPGQAVTLMGDAPKAGDPRVSVGTGTVLSSEATSAGNNRLTLQNVSTNAGVDIVQVRAIAPANGGASIAGPVAGPAQGKPLIEPLYLQGAGVGLLMLAGSILVYWLVGVKPGPVEFLIATDGEMRKVNWSSRRDIIGSTWVVILWSFLIAGGLFTVDLAFSKFFQLIGVLQQ